MPITGNAYTDWVATTQSTSNEWQYFYLNNARTTATLLPSYQNGNEVVPNEPQWDNNEDGGISGDYPFIQRVTSPNTNVPSGTMRNAMGGIPNIVMHPSELNDRLPALTFKNTSGVTKLVSGTITLKLMNPVDTFDGIQYFFQRNLVNGTRYNLHSSGTILKNNTGTVTITFTDYELQANEHLYLAVESRVNYIYDHVITSFSINVPSSYAAQPSTASALMVDATISTNKPQRSGYQKRIASLSPTYWLRFDETGTPLDYGSSSLQVSVTGSPLYNQTSFGTQTDKSVLLNGTNGFSSTANTTIFNDKQFTIECWFKISNADVLSSNYHTFFIANGSAGQVLGFRMKGAAESSVKGTLQMYYLAGAGFTDKFITTTTNYADGNWHHAALTFSSTTAIMYVDGAQISSVAINTSFPSTLSLDGTGSKLIAYTTNEGLRGNYNEFAIYDSTLTVTQLADNYAARNWGNYDAQVGEVSTSTFVMPTITIVAVVNAGYGASAMLANTAVFVHPTIEAIRNINCSADPFTASATSPNATATATKTVTYLATPATASALLSSNFYGGNTGQDTTYTLTLRELQTETGGNISANNGFSIGRNKAGTVTLNQKQLLLIPIISIPDRNKLVKVKFNSTHLGITTTNDVAPDNRFNIYKITQAIASPTTVPASDIQKTLLYTTRLLDDSTTGNSNFYLDLTPAFADASAYANGIVIESANDGTSYTGWDETIFTGSNLQHELLYILSADILNKNINADAMTASSLATDATISVQVYINVSADPSTASADIVTPTAGFSTGFNAAPATASGEAIQPTFSRTVEYPHTFASAFAEPVNPTLFIEGSNSYAAAPATASADFHMPQANIGENHIADHMNASALFVMPTLAIPRVVDAMTTTASVTMVQPALNSQLLGAYKAQPMIASALYPNPPAYTNLFLDKWYSLLYNQHSIRHNFRTPNGGNGEAILKLFDDVTSSKNIGSTLNNNLSYTIQSDGIIEDAGPAPAMNVVGEFSPSDNFPLISKGYYDNYERKAVKVNNISVGYEGSEFINTGFSFELSIKTTKSDQIIAFGRTRSYYGSQANATALGLSDGKLFLTRTQTIGAAPVVHYKQTIPTLTKIIGNKRIDDGEWHHIVIQNGWNDQRIQFWIDGTLDRQISPGARLDGISFIGFNSNISTYASNFETSVWSFDSHAFPREHEIDDHRFAYIKYEPVRAEPMLATATATQENAAAANRSRMLLLYWWQNRVGYNQYVNDRIAGITTGFDGNNSPFRPEDLIDNATSAPLEWYGWDVFPVNVLEPKASDIIKQDNIENGKYVDRENAGVTRWLDLQKDLKLEQFDTIMFANYPTTSAQLDSYLGSEYVDDYFNVTERVLYNDFLISLRKAVDSGMSLFIQFDQLARDLKIYDRVEVIPFFEDEISDKRAFWHTNNVAWDLVNNRPDAYESRNPGDPGYLIFDEDKAIDRAYVDVDRGAYYYDWYNNARHRVVNTIEKLTDDASYIITDRAHYKHSEESNFGSPDRWYERFEYKIQGLQPGDEFVFGDPNKFDPFGNTRAWRSSCYAIPFANIKAGKVITAQPEKYWRENVYTDNPYKNYAHSIALEPGDVLDGKGIGGKIFVSISEVFWDQTPEYKFLDLYYDYWINIAFDLGIITADEKNDILDSSEYVSSLNKTSEHYDWETYWSRNDNFAFTQIDKGQNLEGIIGLIFQDTDLPIAPRSRKALADYSRNRDSLGRFASGAGGSGALFVKLTSGRTTNTMNIFTPNILTRALWWLSDRLRPTGLVNRVANMPVSVTMPGGIAVVDKNLSVLAPVMNSNAIFAANVSGTITITTQSIALPSLPLTASAMSPDLGTTIKASLFIANASMKEAGVFAFLLEEVILTVAHQDAVVYVKGDKIT